jgi:hypothetical protein
MFNYSDWYKNGAWLGVPGVLDVASLATQAWAAVSQLRETGKANREPLLPLARLLPCFFSARSLAEVQESHIDTLRVILLYKAYRKTGLPKLAGPTFADFAVQLIPIQKDLERLAGGEILDRQRLQELESFCESLAKTALEAFPLPEPGGDALRLIA